MTGSTPPRRQDAVVQSTVQIQNGPAYGTGYERGETKIRPESTKLWIRPSVAATATAWHVQPSSHVPWTLHPGSQWAPRRIVQSPAVPVHLPVGEQRVQHLLPVPPPDADAADHCCRYQPDYLENARAPYLHSAYLRLHICL